MTHTWPCALSVSVVEIEVDSLPGEVRNSHHEYLVKNKMNTPGVSVI